MNKILFAILLISSSSIAQTDGLGSWNILNFKYKVNKKINLFAESQLRSLKFYNDFHYYEYKGGIDFQASKSLKLTLGLGDYNTFSVGGSFKSPVRSDEFRIWPQVTLNQNLGNFSVEQRYRLEFRFTNNELNRRFRYRLGINYKLNSRNSSKPLVVGIFNEIFFTDIEPYFVRNRISAQLKKEIIKNLSFMIGYLHQFDYKINDESGKDFLQTGFYIDLN